MTLSRISTATLVALLTAGTLSAQLKKEAVPGIVNYTRVDASVACGGATDPSALAELKRQGFVSVVNFRMADEPNANIDASKAAAQAAGLKYFHIPFSSPTVEATGTFLKTVADRSNQPVYIHCASANRVGAMWLIKRVKLDGWEIGRATTEAETIGLRSQPLKEFALEYVKTH